MKKRVLCYLGWHKWGERKYSIRYWQVKKELLCQSVSVRCLHPMCGHEKSFERRV